MTDELKLCPFCGEPARLFRIVSDDRISRHLWAMWIVGCETDLCPGYIWKAGPTYFSKDMATEYWNKRSGDGADPGHAGDEENQGTLR